jgi:ATP-dependent DNA ligase
MGRGVDRRRHELQCWRWLKPQLVAAIEFLEWTPDARLRHPKFTALRDDRSAEEIARDNWILVKQSAFASLLAGVGA